MATFVHRRSRYARGRAPKIINDQIEVFQYHKQGLKAAAIRFREAAMVEGCEAGNLRIEWLKESRDYDQSCCLIFPWAKIGSATPAHVQYNFRRMTAARAMCFIAHGAPADLKMMAIHSCGNGHISCVNPKHLRWGTHEDNMKDMAAHGTAKGELSGQAKLAERDVMTIFSRMRSGAVASELASEFGVSETTVRGIAAGKTWAWLTALHRM